MGLRVCKLKETKLSNSPLTPPSPMVVLSANWEYFFLYPPSSLVNPKKAILFSICFPLPKTKPFERTANTTVKSTFSYLRFIYHLPYIRKEQKSLPCVCVYVCLKFFSKFHINLLLLFCRCVCVCLYVT